MKKMYLLMAISTILMLVTNPAFSQTLVASYPFNGNANDASGNGNNGNAAGAVLTTDRFGAANKAYSFAGGTNVITAADNATLALTTNFSASAWVYASATPPATGGGTAFTIVCKDASPGNNNPKWIFGLQNGGLAFHSNGPGLGSGEWVYSNTFSLSLNTWYYCAFSKAGNNVSFYLNGSSMGTFALPSASVNPAAPLAIGFSEAGLSTTGKIDEVNVYNYSLSAAQIATDYSNSSLVASYPFTGNANDASGNGNDGTVNGAVLTADRFGNANSAYSFNGSSSYINVTNSTSLQLSNSYTLSAWVKPNAFYNGSCQANFILAKGDQASEGHYNLQYGDFLDGSCGTYTPSNENFASTVRKGAADQSVYENPSALALSLNNWYYVVCTYDGAVQKLFVNGKLRASNTTSGSFGALNAQNLFIGKSNDASGYFVNGVIDDIKIYSTALPDAQIFDTYINDFKKPGSGNVLNFNGSNTYVETPDNESFSFGTSMTASAWIKTNGFDEDIVCNFETASPFQGFLFGVGFGCNGNNFDSRAGKLAFYIGNTIGNISLSFNDVLGPRVDDGKWHHVAATYNGTNVAFFVDGIQTSSSAATQPIGNSSNLLRIGRDNNLVGSRYFIGQIDELQLWNTPLSQTQIRDWMCKKVTSAHPAYQNLVAYFKFDEGSNATTDGYGGNFGTLINSPAWQTSGAALGDAAVHDFVNATKAVNINAATGENFAVTSTSGNPNGIVVYRVDEAPNSITGANNGANNKYFGVFQSGGTSPQYTAVYNYAGNPFVNAGNETNLRLAKRTDNSVSVWTQLGTAPNTTLKTITVTGQSTEYILGDLTGPLPVTLVLFTASKDNGSIQLNWVTENEINLQLYQVEKSTDAKTFTTLGSLFAKGGTGSRYNTADAAPYNGMNYYRLKMIDKDGRFSYSNTIKIDLDKNYQVNVLPNPAHDYLMITGTKKIEHIQVADMNGKVVKAFAKSADNIYPLNNLAPGMYILNLIGTNEKLVYKIMIQ